MKRTIGWLAMALALGACGDDKPKKKKAQAATAAVATTTTAVATAEVAQTAPAPEPSPVPPAQTVAAEQPAYTPVELPTDEQSGYKAYIEPTQQTNMSVQQVAATHEPVGGVEAPESTVPPPAVSPESTNSPLPQQPVGIHPEQPIDPFNNPSLEMMQN